MLLLLLLVPAAATWYEPQSDAYPSQDAGQFGNQNVSHVKALPLSAAYAQKF
jgi:hypothetical protein